MITLTLPSNDHEIYVVVQGVLVGPWPSANSSSASISRRSGIDSISEQRGGYHENFVQHSQATGEISFSPVHREIRPAPTTTYPDRVVWSAKTLTGSATEVSASMGIGEAGRATLVRNSSSSDNYAWIQANTARVIAWRVTAPLSSPYNPNSVGGFEYEFVREDSSTVYWRWRTITRTWGISGPPRSSLNWTERRTFAEIEAYCATAKTVSVGSWQTSLTQTVKRKTSMPFENAPEQFFNYIDLLLLNDMVRTNYPVASVEYGTLAMEASQRVNASNINMLAFLSELRNIRQLIFKLRNLRNLKTWANNYLAVEYGWLPTISDIKEILGAFERLKPHLDRNGFTTYHAGHEDSRSEGNISFKLEQRIKLAISDEDDAFEVLLTGWEMMGILPNLKTIWDLIPFSFVIDWFINVGETLEKFDAVERIARFNIRYVTMSRKETTRKILTPSVESPYIGAIELVQYHRWVSDQCPVPSSFAPQTSNPTSHWLDGAALYVQRRK